MSTAAHTPAASTPSPTPVGASDTVAVHEHLEPITETMAADGSDLVAALRPGCHTSHPFRPPHRPHSEPPSADGIRRTRFSR